MTLTTWIWCMCKTRKMWAPNAAHIWVRSDVEARYVLARDKHVIIAHSDVFSSDLVER